MRIPRKVALFGATAVTLALIPASSAIGYSPGEKRAEKKQNARVAKLAKDVNTIKNQLGPLAADLPGAVAKLNAVDDRLKVIENAAPAIVKGLGDLKTGLETAAAGLGKLQKLATSTEYGVGQVFIGATPLAGGFLVTPDIPDAVQQAQTSGTFLSTGAGTITVQVAVRSAETDGDGTTPAAHCRVTATGSGGSTTTSKPNPALGGAPFWPINTKSAQTSTEAANAGFPFGPKTSGADADNLSNLTDISGGGNAVAPGGPATEAASSSAGQPISVQLSCVDASPSTEDPSA